MYKLKRGIKIDLLNTGMNEAFRMTISDARLLGHGSSIGVRRITTQGRRIGLIQITS